MLDGDVPWLAPQTPPPLAGWGARFAAFLLDLLFLAVPIVVFGIVAATFGKPSGQVTVVNGVTYGNDGNETIYLVFILLIPLYFIGLGLAQLILQGSRGATLGKNLVGIRLVNATTLRPVGFGTCIGRQILHMLDSLPLYIGWLAPLWTPKKQTFADMMVDSIVIKDPLARYAARY